MNRRISLSMAAAFVGLGAVAQAAEPGTATPPAGTMLVDAATGEKWSAIGQGSSATWTLTGPARFQVGFKVNLPDNGEAVPAGIVQVRHGGKPLAQYRLLPKPGKDTWKDMLGFKPSTSVGFLIDVAPGDQQYEIRLNGGGKLGGAAWVIDATKSPRPLPANAPVVAIPGAPIVAVASPTATATATPVASVSPAPTATPEATASPRAQPSDAANPLAIWLGARQAEETRAFVTGAAPASELALGARWTPVSMAQVWVGLGYEATEDVVPMPLAPVTRVKETRMLVDAGGGYRLGLAGASLVAGPSIHYASIDNSEVGYGWLFASLAGRAEVPLGPLTATAGGEAGIPVADATPSGWQDGTLLDRYAWSLGARYTQRSLPTSPSLGVEYRGERVAREYSELVSHGVRLVVQVEF